MANDNGLDALPTHVDIMDWRARTGRTAGEVDADLANWIARLADDAQPLGLLTHHLAHDETAWAVLDALLELLAGHPAAAWSDVGAMLRTC